MSRRNYFGPNYAFGLCAIGVLFFWNANNALGQDHLSDEYFNQFLASLSLDVLMLPASDAEEEDESPEEIPAGTGHFEGTVTTIDGFEYDVEINIVYTFHVDDGYRSDVTITDEWGGVFTFIDEPTSRFRDGGSHSWNDTDFSGFQDVRTGEVNIEFWGMCGPSVFEGNVKPIE